MWDKPLYTWSYFFHGLKFFPLCTHIRNFLENHQDFNPLCAGLQFLESMMGPNSTNRKEKDLHNTHKHYCCLPEHRLWSLFKKSKDVVISSRASHSCFVGTDFKKACLVICLIWLNTGFCVETLYRDTSTNFKTICLKTQTILCNRVFRNYTQNYTLSILASAYYSM